jgi:hypothetical protein
MIKRNYMAPAINMKVIFEHEQLMAASPGPPVDDSDEDDGFGQDAKISSGIWEYITSKED